MSIQPNPSAPLWPAEWQGCTFTAQYIDFTGAPIAGTVTFTPTATAVFAGISRKIAVGTAVSVDLDSNGALNITLPATDDPETNPVGWTYSVVEGFPGGRSYSLEAPRNQVIDLTQATPVPTANGTAIVRGPAGPESLVVSSDNPGLEVPGVWIQTGLGPLGNDFTFWIEDGQ